MFGKYDIITFILILALVSAGTIAIYSATSVADVDANSFFVRQVMWAILGVLIMITVSIIPLRIINRFSYWFYGFTLFSLLLVYVVGKVGQGAERWLVIGPLHIQPSEFAKLATVLAVSKFLSDQYADINKIKYWKKQKIIHVKEIKFRPGTDVGDYDIKLRKLKEFLENGDKTKVTLRFRGRELAHKELGTELLKRVEKDLEEYGSVEQFPKFEGRQMVMVLAPKKT